MKKTLIWVFAISASVIFIILVSLQVWDTGDKNTQSTDTKQFSIVKDTAAVVEANVGYKEIDYPTPKYEKDVVNDVQGVILHHTAEPTVERSLAILTTRERNVSTHVVIDTDGTRYILAKPERVTYHAGLSILNGRESCNNFTIGIEFQGNTLESPLTENQIYSAIEYIKPIIKKYNIPIENIVTHEMVRTAYKEKYPHKKCSGKIDITQEEYKRFIGVLNICIE